MSIKQLRAFHYVALAGGFSQAARELAISQSTLSGQVGQLEASTGVSLFDRKPRGAVVTSEGQALLELTTRLFAAEAEVRDFLRDEGGRSGGYLRVAADGPVLPLPILASLRTARPRLRISLSIDNSDRVIDALVNYRADVGITARYPTDTRLHAQQYLTMNLGLCVPAGHELSERSSVTMQDLAGRSFILREKGSLTREVFEKNIRQHGVDLGTVMEISTREGGREAVSAGFGIGVVADLEFGHDARLRFVPISDAHHTISEYAVCLAERKHLPLVREFLLKAEACGHAARQI
jgi:aminoethylphosphonate catabolism LysR family transcriptional regulator